MPVILTGNEEQKKKYLGRMTAANADNPLMCVSVSCQSEKINFHVFFIDCSLK